MTIQYDKTNFQCFNLNDYTSDMFLLYAYLVVVK